MYIHSLPDWPQFTWDYSILANVLSSVSKHQGILIGRMTSLGFESQRDTTLNALTDEVVHSSAIEGEHLDRDAVRSSIARHLGIDTGISDRSNRNVEGVVGIMLDATQKYEKPLTQERLCRWHTELFPYGHIGYNTKAAIGRWREGRLRVVSGNIGDPNVHFEAPDALRLNREMADFLDWFNGNEEINPLLKSGVAHLWFVTIHPFDDGNGRIARAIADMVLARADGTAQRFYSMSHRLLIERKKYYDALEAAQRGTMDITRWLDWYLQCLGRALDESDDTLDTIARRDVFWRLHAGLERNDRQRRILNMLFQGFEGNLTSSKWAKINKCSSPTAVRDINELTQLGILRAGEGGGRSTCYFLVEPDSGVLR